VVRNHAWTNSPPSAREEVPTLSLEEQRITINPTLNQLAYNFFAMTGKMGNMFNTAKTALAGITGGAKSDHAKGVSNAIRNLHKDLVEKAKTMNQHTYKNHDSTNPQKPYDALYSTESTGFKYILPYFTNTMRSGNLGFGTGGGEGGMNSIFDMLGAGGIAQGMADITKSMNVSAPGVYIEQPKFYSFSGRESSYTVTFPLLNTGTFDDVLRNWQFLYLLTYQNMPNRISRDIIEPPVIYTARIPGMWFARYAAITNLQVEFQGARRMMELEIPMVKPSTKPGEGNTSVQTVYSEDKTFKTIIPDAYNVSITVTELFGETKNMAYQMLQDDFDITVNRILPTPAE
jgi:hypothetical protein